MVISESESERSVGGGRREGESEARVINELRVPKYVYLKRRARPPRVLANRLLGTISINASTSK